MNCEQAREMLADYLGDELNVPDRETFEQHLADCDPCRQEVESLAGAVQALRSLAPPGEAEVTGTGTTESAPRLAAPGRTASRPLGAFLRPLAYAAVLAIGVGIGWTAKPAPPAVDPPEQPARQSPASRSIEERIRSGDLNPYARNALALSTAFNRPAAPRADHGEHR